MSKDLKDTVASYATLKENDRDPTWKEKKRPIPSNEGTRGDRSKTTRREKLANVVKQSEELQHHTESKEIDTRCQSQNALASHPSIQLRKGRESLRNIRKEEETLLDWKKAPWTCRPDRRRQKRCASLTLGTPTDRCWRGDLIRVRERLPQDSGNCP